MTIIWDVTSCSPVEVYPCFGGYICLHKYANRATSKKQIQIWIRSPPKCRRRSVGEHDITNEKTVILKLRINWIKFTCSRFSSESIILSIPLLSYMMQRRTVRYIVTLIRWSISPLGNVRAHAYRKITESGGALCEGVSTEMTQLTFECLDLVNLVIYLQAP